MNECYAKIKPSLLETSHLQSSLILGEVDREQCFAHGQKIHTLLNSLLKLVEDYFKVETPTGEAFIPSLLTYLVSRNISVGELTLQEIADSYENDT